SDWRQPHFSTFSSDYERDEIPVCQNTVVNESYAARSRPRQVDCNRTITVAQEQDRWCPTDGRAFQGVMHPSTRFGSLNNDYANIVMTMPPTSPNDCNNDDFRSEEMITLDFIGEQTASEGNGNNGDYEDTQEVGTEACGYMDGNVEFRREKQQYSLHSVDQFRV
uniref:Kinesin motor domain-containing protein n=1 Tax=Ascaris lumbricoides TaxID=6252 RepID=A0A0M3I1V1_ASCLU